MVGVDDATVKHVWNLRQGSRERLAGPLL